MKIRLATEEDLPELALIASEAYAQKGIEFELDVVIEWAKKVINDPNSAMFRGDKSCGVVYLRSNFWNPNVLIGIDGPVFSTSKSPREALNIMKSMIDWCKHKGAQSFQFWALTGIDFGPFAKKLGAVPGCPVYTVTFER